MRFKIKLERIKNDLLPMDYQYPLSSWIYSALEAGDANFSNWLHNTGYQIDNRNFKLFCFSRIFIPKFAPKMDRIQIQSKEAELQISFAAPKALEPFVIGLFQNQSLRLGDSKSSVEFTIHSVESLPEKEFTDKAQFTARSPICISALSPNRNTATYLSPEDPSYAQHLKSNLLHKYNSFYAESPIQDVPFSFRLLNRPDSKLITIRKGEPSETKVRGYLFSFEVSTSKQLLSFAYSAGFGEKNSMGFGFVDKK